MTLGVGSVFSAMDSCEVRESFSPGKLMGLKPFFSSSMVSSSA